VGPPPSEPFAHSAGRELGRLRIAATLAPPIADAELDPSCERAVADASELLRSLGHDVQEVDPPWAADGLRELFGTVFSTGVAQGIDASGRVAGREVAAEDVEPMSWAIYCMIRNTDAIAERSAEIALQAYARRLVAFLLDYDVLLTPALGERPLPIGALDTAAPNPMETFTRSGLFTPFTPIFNATGLPAISLPLFQGDDELPLGVQLAGRPADEATLIALAAQLEGALPWAERRPTVGALDVGR